MNSLESFLNILCKLNDTYSIGVHGVTGEGDYIKKGYSIIMEGLKNNGWGGLLSNVTMLGQLKNFDDNTFATLLNYFYSLDMNERFVNIVVAVPEVIEDSSGKKFFLGHYNPTRGYSKGVDEAGDSLPLNVLIENISLLPKEFILGFYCGKFNSKKFEFIPNPNFIDYKDEEYKSKFYDLIISEISRLYFRDIDSEILLLERYPRYASMNDEYHRQLRDFIAKYKNTK